MHGDSGDDSDGGLGGWVKARLGRLDEFQREHTSLAVLVAVFRKFDEDQSVNLASMIAFWAFFSVFPLCLVFVTLLGFLLPGTVKAKVLADVSGMLPLLDPSSVHALGGSWWALIVGMVTALWSGLAVVRTAESAFNSVWKVPASRWPTILAQVARGLSVLATVGLGLVLSTLITGFVAGATVGVGLGWFGRVVGYVAAIALDVGLFVAAFRLLTDRQITTKDVLPGALASGVLFWVLQSVSSLIISRYLHSAQNVYGQFATVITVLWWFYLQSLVTLLGAELNVVLKEHLHPRPLVDEAEEAEAEPPQHQVAR